MDWTGSSKSSPAVIGGIFLLSSTAVFALLWQRFAKPPSIESINPNYSFSQNEPASLDPAIGVEQLKFKVWHFTPEFPVEIAQFETVFWDPKDADSMRKSLPDGQLRSATVLEVGTGTGLVSLHCQACSLS